MEFMKSKNGFAAFTILLLFLCFLFSLLSAEGVLKWALTIMSLIFALGFAVFAILKWGDKSE